MYAEQVIKNGKCMVMKDGKTAEWTAVSGDRIVGVGDGEAWKEWAGPETRIIDAGGNTVLPGFIDNHVHVILTAVNLASVKLSGVTSFEDIGSRIRSEAEKGDGGHIRCIHLELEQLAENRPPNRLELDKFCSDAPVSLHTTDYQVSILNTYALMYFKIPFTTPGVELDEKGLPTGIFRREANAVLYSNTLKNVTDEYRMSLMPEMMNRLLKNGITSISAMEGGRMCDGLGYNPDLEFLLRHRSEFPVDMECYYPTIDIDRVLNLGLDRIGGVIYLDGTIGGHTAAITFQYADERGGSGLMRMDQEDLNEYVLNCYKNKLQLSLFSLGDRAVDAALAAHENALNKTGITGLRHRLEHAVLARTDQMKRAAELGMVFSMMPAYEREWGGPGRMYSQRLGTEYRRTNPLKDVKDSGVVLCGSSDSDVTEARPLLGIHWAVNHPVKEHRLTLYEALELYTCAGAYAMGKESEKGTLECGKKADIVILDRDLDSVRSDEIDTVGVALTMKSGEILCDAL